MSTTMLIVDDSRVSRMMIRKFAQELRPDWQFIEATSGDEALEIATNQDFQLVSMDFNMPGLNGLEASLRLHELRPELKIALFTANVQESNRNRAEAQGLHFVAKPVSLASVKSIVELLEY
jgi:CheY-like chemotaxis protein